MSLFRRELVIAADDPLGAEWVNRNREAIEAAGLAVSTSAYIPAGNGFLADGRGSGTLIKFEDSPDEPEGRP